MFNTSANTITKPFAVTRFDGEEIKILNSYATYAEADDAYTRYCDKFPNACIDIEDLRDL